MLKLKINRTRNLFLILFSLFFIIFNSCSVPRRTLTEQEKLADLAWFQSKINENYAPLDYKSKRFGFDVNELFAKYEEKVKATKTNGEFYLLMQELVAELNDGHVGVYFFPSMLPNRTKIHYLGFSGKRMGDGYMVTGLLPTIKPDNFPIKEGDIILAYNGVPLIEFIDTKMTKYMSVGQEESNRTILMRSIFGRVPFYHPAPESDWATLTVERGFDDKGMPIFVDVKIPWITKDYVTFLREQSAAEESAVSKDSSVKKYFGHLYPLPANISSMIPQNLKRIFTNESPVQKFNHSFRYVGNVTSWDSDFIQAAVQDKQGMSTLDRLYTSRYIPENAIFLNVSQEVPTYISMRTIDKPVEGSEQFVTETKYVAYMYLSTFSVWGESRVIEEVKSTINLLKKNGVKDIVIDLINNGGGSLSFGLNLAQLFSSKKLVLPELQVRLNESWMDEFEFYSIYGGSDYDRELSRRIYEGLMNATNEGKRLSGKMGTDIFIGTPEVTLQASEQFNIALLVNEMCASMCDLFTGIMKDNGLVTVIGSQTMGAGGNVVSHMSAPNSNFIVSTTESMMLRNDSQTYYENNGVMPDIAVPVSEFSMSNYTEIIEMGLDSFFY